jgi:hypothetical protein
MSEFEDMEPDERRELMSEVRQLMMLCELKVQRELIVLLFEQAGAMLNDQKPIDYLRTRIDEEFDKMLAHGADFEPTVASRLSRMRKWLDEGRK